MEVRGRGKVRYVRMGWREDKGGWGGQEGGWRSGG